MKREENKKNIQPGDSVRVTIPYPETATFEEISDLYTHTGKVLQVCHSPGGSLRIYIEGLEGKSDWKFTYPMYVEKCPALPQTSAAPAAAQPVFEHGDSSILANVFEINAASNRQLTRLFIGDVIEQRPGVYQIENFKNDHVYTVKIEEVSRQLYRVGCTCWDFNQRKRVCKHIYELFEQNQPAALKAAA